MNARRLIVYLLLNAIVSAGATLSVLWWWDRYRSPAGMPVAQAEATATLPAAVPPSPTARVGSAPTEPAPTPTIYIVKAGDTLGRIAEQYGVPVEEIMAANGIADANLLAVGQTLVIPVPGYVPPTAQPATPSLLATNPAEPPLATATRDPNVPLPRLEIREVRDAGDLAEEVLVIVNAGGPVDLAGWSLRDETGHFYVFPSLMLFEDGAVNVHTAPGTDTVTDLYWGQAQPVWAPGKSVLLSDAGGNLHARYTVP